MSLYKPQRYIGVMSGTSLDAVDVAAVQFNGRTFTLLHTYNHPIPQSLRDQVHALNQGQAITLDKLGELDHAFGSLFSEAVLTLLKQANLRAKDIIAVGCHGQTVRHKPNIPFPFTMQIGDPNIIVKQTGIQTVADFRRADVAIGGQGAPLVPPFHASFFHSPDENRIVLNLGGIANLTYLPAKENGLVKGYDIGPANALIDLWCEKHLGQPFDRDGEWAKSGQVNASLLEIMLACPYFAQKAPKSTGKELFNLSWVEESINTLKKTNKDIQSISSEDVQATLLALTAHTIAQALNHHLPKGRVLVCGGGVHNKSLMNALSNHCPNLSIESCEFHGMHPDWVEAICFAWLAYQRIHLQPGNLPEVTGAKHPTVLGALYAI